MATSSSVRSGTLESRPTGMEVVVMSPHGRRSQMRPKGDIRKALKKEGIDNPPEEVVDAIHKGREVRAR